MEKRIVAFVLSVCIFNSLFSQDSILSRKKLPNTLYYYDDFIDYRNRWIDEENLSVKYFTKNGFFHMQNKQTHGSYIHYDNYNIDPAHNYFVEMDFLLENGEQDAANGMLFNHTSTKRRNEFQFLITNNQDFTIRKQINSSFSDIISSQHHPAIHIKGMNRLGVHSMDGYLYFYINGTLVHKMKSPIYIGNDIGFLVAAQSTIAVDKISVYYDPPAINEIEDARKEYDLENVGTAINSSEDEVFPVVSADGKLMFFSRCSTVHDARYEKRAIMFSEFNDKTGQWSQANMLPENVNQGKSPQLVYISPDKNTIILNATYIAGINVADEGLSVSQRTADGWSTPETMKIEGLQNMDRYESYAISSSGKAMIMSVNALGSYGQRDLYVSFKLPDGSWAKPKNLGGVINSFGHEDSPCLAPDNVTMYYTSDGKPGYGSSDLFVTHRLDDTWLNWSAPQNLGPHVNDRFANGWLQVDAHGDYAYTQTRESNHTEIKKFVMPEAARPNPVVMIKGTVYNRLTKAPISIPVIYENMETGYEEGTANASPIDGSFILVLPWGVNYGFTTKMKGYICESKNVNLTVDSLKHGFAEMSIDLYVIPLKIGQSITLNNIFFGPNEHELKEASFSELDRLVALMNENPTLEVEVNGYTDHGDPNALREQLLLLSQKRANSVRDYAIKKGIDVKRITSIGMGNTKPVSDDQRLNRRVEVRITNL